MLINESFFPSDDILCYKNRQVDQNLMRRQLIWEKFSSETFAMMWKLFDWRIRSRETYISEFARELLHKKCQPNT